MKKKRVFLGIKVPFEGNLKKIYEKSKDALDKEKIKWVAPENLHFTLHFLAGQDIERIENLIQQIDKNPPAVAPFQLELRGLGVFRNLRNPRVLWIGSSLGGMKKLHGELLDPIREAGIELPADIKPFKAHLTLGRIKHIEDTDALSRHLKDHADSLIETLEVNSFNLIESILEKNGPVYKTWKEFPLKD
jgi:2'-5' RNA ligase